MFIPTSMSRLPRKCHQGMLVQLPCLIVRRFQDGSTSHCCLGSSDKGKVLASDPEKHLPRLKLESTYSVATVQNSHICKFTLVNWVFQSSKLLLVVDLVVVSL